MPVHAGSYAEADAEGDRRADAAPSIWSRTSSASTEPLLSPGSDSDAETEKGLDHRAAIDGCGAVAPPARASRASLLLRANRLSHSLRSLEAPIDVIKSHLAKILSGLPQVRKHLLSVEIKPPFLLAAAVLFLGGSLAPHRRSRGRRADELGVDCKAKNTEFIFPGLGGSLAPHRRSRAGVEKDCFLICSLICTAYPT